MKHTMFLYAGISAVMTPSAFRKVCDLEAGLACLKHEIQNWPATSMMEVWNLLINVFKKHRYHVSEDDVKVFHLASQSAWRTEAVIKTVPDPQATFVKNPVHLTMTFHKKSVSEAFFTLIFKFEETGRIFATDQIYGHAVLGKSVQPFGRTN